MNENRVKRNRLLGEKIVKGLESRNMEGYYADTKEDALAKALEWIPQGSSVSWGCSMSVNEIGLKQAVRENNGFGNFGSNGPGLYQRFRCDCFIQLAFLIDMVRSVDLARHMGYSKSSISRTVSILCKGGFLVKDDSGFFAFY